MTDAEIIKALECCAVHGLLKCEKCPKKNEGVTCMYALSKDALDLINRQKAQIEKLEKVEHFATETIHKQVAEIEKSEKEFNDKFNSLVASNVYLINRVDKARTEAIKEFAFDLTEEVKQIDMTKPHEDKDDIRIHVYDIIDSLVKEKEGKEDA